MFVVGAFAALGALCFARAASEQRLKRKALIATLALGASAFGLTILADDRRPLIDIRDTALLKNDAYVSVRWNSHSRVTVSGNPEQTSNAGGWGLSEKTGATNAQVRQLAMAIDTWAGTGSRNRRQYRGAFLPEGRRYHIAHTCGGCRRFVAGRRGRDLISGPGFRPKSVNGWRSTHVLRA